MIEKTSKIVNWPVVLLRTLKSSVATFLIACSAHVNGLELVIAQERVEPGIVFVFEGAVKDRISPSRHHLAESETHVHIEARVNWDTRSIPPGAVPGGFVPYLYISARVINEATGLSTFIDLLPHINLIDNFHYARNMTLPGAITDKYSVEFIISPPTNKDLALHHDWLTLHGQQLAKPQNYQYQQVDFSDIAAASRR